MKIDRQQWQMVIALLIVALVCTVLLSATNSLTQKPIAQAQRDALMSALMQVLPEHQNDPIEDTQSFTVSGQNKPIQFYYSRNQRGEITGIAWQITASDGYNGSIHILMAVHPDGNIHAIRIIGHKETPGLGDGITDNQIWLDSFNQQSLTTTEWAVKKDGGDFDQFTGATITPRAVVKAVKKGLEMFTKLQEKLLNHSVEPKSEK